MANSLLDFVMSLVRDADAAARYAADPAQAIADAQLAGVTSVDVNNLIPMVAESLAMSNPMIGTETLAAEPAGNVWASGAATAAFDAFDDQSPTPADDGIPAIVTDRFDEPAPEPADVGASLQFDDLPEVVTDLVTSEEGTDVPVVDDWQPADFPSQPESQPDDLGDGFDFLT